MLALLLAAALGAEYEALIAYDTVQVADGVVAFLPKRTDHAMVSGNCVAVIGEDGVLLVDSGHFPAATRRMLGQLRELTRKPVRWLVNTHWHGDHHRGNAVIQQAFPDLAIISTEPTRLKFADPGIQDEPGVMRKQHEDMAAMLASGKTPSGKGLTGEQRKRYGAALRELEISEADISTAPPLRPNLTFSDKLVLHLGGRDAEVLFLGRGNTAGDALVHVPALKLLITGDLVVYPAPYAFGSFFGEWGPTLRKAIALHPSIVVPGHGPVMHDTSYLELVAEAVDAVSAQVKALAQQGLSLDEVRKRLDLRKIRERFAKGDEELGRRFDGFLLGPGVPRAYREAKEGVLQDEE